MHDGLWYGITVQLRFTCLMTGFLKKGIERIETYNQFNGDALCYVRCEANAKHFPFLIATHHIMHFSIPCLECFQKIIKNQSRKRR
jgi:hypothetical protein